MSTARRSASRTQRDVAARFEVAVSTIAAFAKEHRTTERPRGSHEAQLDPRSVPPPPKVPSARPGARARDVRARERRRQRRAADGEHRTTVG